MKYRVQTFMGAWVDTLLVPSKENAAYWIDLFREGGTDARYVEEEPAMKETFEEYRSRFAKEHPRQYLDDMTRQLHAELQLTNGAVKEVVDALRKIVAGAEADQWHKVFKDIVDGAAALKRYDAENPQ